MAESMTIRYKYLDSNISCTSSYISFSLNKMLKSARDPVFLLISSNNIELLNFWESARKFTVFVHRKAIKFLEGYSFFFFY